MPNGIDHDPEGPGMDATVIGWRVYNLEKAVHALETWRDARLSADASILELVKANTLAVQEMRESLRSILLVALASFLSVVGETIYQVLVRRP